MRLCCAGKIEIRGSARLIDTTMNLVVIARISELGPQLVREAKDDDHFAGGGLVTNSDCDRC